MSGSSARGLAALCCLTAIGCGGEAPPAAKPAEPSGPTFHQVSAAAGIDHVHGKPVLDAKLAPIMPWVASIGAAAAAADFDRDGRLDLYVTTSNKGEPNRLYRNNGDGTFTDVAAAAGVAEVNDARGVSMDAAWGDVDADGWPDLYLVRWGTDSLYRNDGDGTFTEVTGRLFRRRDGKPGIDFANGNGVIFWDYDLDGRLDIYVGNYFRAENDLFDLTTTRIMHDSFEKAQNAGVNFVFHQRRDGTFEEVAEKLGLQDPGWTLDVGSADVDNDGWPDLYAADDFGPDRLFLNRGDGTFRDVTAEAMGFDTKKGMNAEFGDYNNDGWLDVYVTNVTTAEYIQEGNMLWHNNGVGPDGKLTLTDVSLETGTYDGGWGWGAKFFDYDLDGDLDLISANGFISAGEGNFWYDLGSWTVLGQDPADAANWPPIGDRTFSGYERTRLWRNDGGTFSDQAGTTGLDSDRDGRGVVIWDYDDDGDLDVYLANQGQPGDLYRNDAAPGRHWLGFALETDPTTGVNRDAIHTRVTVVAGGRRQIRERDGGNGYAAQGDPRVLFGLGGEARAELVEIRWPDGGLQYLEDVAAGRYVTVRQDPAQYAEGGRIAASGPDRRETGRSEAPPPVQQIDPATLDRQLGEMEAKLRVRPFSHALAARYRAHAAAHGAHDRPIDFFAAQIGNDPGDLQARLELASAFIDKVPTCGGVAAVVCKGTLAKKSLDQLDAVVAAAPESWSGHYSRGINHLHWPRGLRHSDDSAADLTKALELERAGRAPASPYVRHLVRVALGDAYVRHDKFAEARQVWQDALKEYPDSADLAERLKFTDDSALSAFVEGKRSLQVDIDTDLSFLDPGLGQAAAAP